MNKCQITRANHFPARDIAHVSLWLIQDYDMHVTTAANNQHCLGLISILLYFHVFLMHCNVLNIIRFPHICHVPSLSHSFFPSTLIPSIYCLYILFHACLLGWVMIFLGWYQTIHRACSALGARSLARKGLPSARWQMTPSD